MDDPKTVNQSPEAAALQGGERVPSITPEGQAVNHQRVGPCHRRAKDERKTGSAHEGGRARRGT